MAFDLDPSYKQVPERIADFKAKHPEGCLRPVNPERPFWVETVDGKTFVCYAAAAYRTPDDPTPGVGVAWEPFPGTTPYTRNSELQNAETSAWGRAIVAVLASESKSVASAEDVRNRQEDHAAEESRNGEAKAQGWSTALQRQAAGTSLIRRTKPLTEAQQEHVRAKVEAGLTRAEWDALSNQIDEWANEAKAAK